MENMHMRPQNIPHYFAIQKTYGQRPPQIQLCSSAAALRGECWRLKKSRKDKATNG